MNQSINPQLIYKLNILLLTPCGASIQPNQKQILKTMSSKSTIRSNNQTRSDLSPSLFRISYPPISSIRSIVNVRLHFKAFLLIIMTLISFTLAI